MNASMKFLPLLALLVTLFLHPLAVVAQDAATPVTDPAAAVPAPVAQPTPAEIAAAAEKAAQEEAARLAILNAPFKGSLLFSAVEVETIRKTAAGRFVGDAAMTSKNVELIPIDRKIKLAGVYYKGPQDWIIWLNGHKLWPRFLLPEIQGIKVNGQEVYLEWYDIGLNGVINITLRPGETYDIVTGILYRDAPAASVMDPLKMGGRR